MRVFKTYFSPIAAFSLFIFSFSCTNQKVKTNKFDSIIIDPDPNVHITTKLYLQSDIDTNKIIPWKIIPGTKTICEYNYYYNNPEMTDDEGGFTLEFVIDNSQQIALDKNYELKENSGIKVYANEYGVFVQKRIDLESGSWVFRKNNPTQIELEILQALKYRQKKSGRDFFSIPANGKIIFKK